MSQSRSNRSEREIVRLELGIMKAGQFTCLGTLQHLRNRFSSGYALQIKVSSDENVQQIRDELVRQLPGLSIQGKQKLQW